MRRAGQGCGPPLVVFGLVVLASAPFYVQRVPSCPPGQSSCSFTVAVTSHWFDLTGLVPSFGAAADACALYWLVTIPLGFAATCLYLVRHARRTGTRSRGRPSLAAVVALLAWILLSNASPSLRAGAFRFAAPASAPDLVIRGLVGLLVIGVGLAVLAGFERSPLLGAVVATYLGLAMLACLDDISNVVTIATSPGAQELPNVVLPGLFLLVSGGVLVAADRRDTLAPGPRPLEAPADP